MARDRHAVIIYRESNRKAYMESPMTPSNLTLRDIKRSKSGSLEFRTFISCKRSELGHMLLLKIDRKAYMGSSLV